MGDPSLGDLFQAIGGGSVALFAYVVWRSLDKLADVMREGFRAVTAEVHDQGERIARIEAAHFLEESEERSAAAARTRTPPRGVIPFERDRDER
jgi:hypothetical protein